MDFNNTGAMRSPFSPRVRQSITGRRPIGLSSAKKNQSKFMQSEQAGEVIYKTPLITVETHGLPLPVMVTEVLTLGSGDVSVRMSECGWCWVVCGRRILAWPRSLDVDDGGAPLAGAHLAARELTLPQTDLAHKADLVVVFYGEGAQMASCVGVSPEGVVRYWPSVGQEGVYSDVSCELAGQECERLAQAAGALVLATTTCTLVLLQPTTVDGRQTVTCRRLCPPSGWLGGIGRRVSLMFFGSMPAHAENRLVGVVGTGGSSAEPHLALVAGGPVLQLWRGPDTHEHALRRALRVEHLHGDAVNADIVALDVRACGTDELLLLLAISAPRQPERRYAIAHINISDPARPLVRAVGALRGGPGGPGGPGAGDEEPRLLPLGSHALAYTSKYIALAALSGPGEAAGAECVCVAADGDRVLGAELCGGRPLLFSRKHGVLLLTLTDKRPPPSGVESPLGSPCPSDMYDGNLSLFEIDPHEISTVTTDACGKLKTAFLFHLRRETAASRALLAALFPARDEDGDADGALARTLVAVAAEMLDDVPAGDPRWRARAGAATNIALGSSSALQAAAQLADKRRALALLADFLRAAGLLQRAGTITIEGGVVVPCEAALCELAERLAAASALRDELARGGDSALLIDAAIQRVVSEEPEPEAGAGAALPARDVVFTRVSRAPRVLAALARAPPPPAPRAAALHHRDTMALLTTVLGEMAKCRAQWSSAAPPPLGPRALLPALVELIKRAVTECLRACPDATLRAQLAEGGAGLARGALLLAAPLQRLPHARAHLDRMRRELIMPFVEEGGTERALALAEAAGDLELVVQLCATRAAAPDLQRYIDKYEHEGMAEIAYSWLAARGGQHAARLVSMRGARLAGWLRAAPARAPLAALHALAAQRPRAAAELLADIADEETASVERMTTAASLGKLCLAAAAEQSRSLAARLERRLALADQHAALPRDLRLHRGLGPGDRVLAPDELVQMYVESESAALTEYDYKKALDLTDYVEDMERRDDLRLRVWCASVRRDSWADGASDINDRMFFRLIDLVHVMGGDLALVLPPLEDILTAPELAELAGAPAFHYQLKYGYECVHSTTRQGTD